jgi:hypothetical protein
MANENKYDSGHVIVPVLHPSGDVHHVAVPEDTDLKDLHSALVDSDYHFPTTSPTAEGALENTPDFREAAKKAYSSVGYGDLPQEAGFMVSKTGKVSPPQLGKEIASGETSGSTTFQIPPEGVFATVHTHPRPTMNKRWTQEPSPPDTEVAKKFKQNVYVITTSGLWQVEPSGKVNHVFTNSDWMKTKKK